MYRRWFLTACLITIIVQMISKNAMAGTKRPGCIGDDPALNSAGEPSIATKRALTPEHWAHNAASPMDVKYLPLLVPSKPKRSVLLPTRWPFRELIPRFILIWWPFSEIAPEFPLFTLDDQPWGYWRSTTGGFVRPPIPVVGGMP